MTAKFEQNIILKKKLKKTHYFYSLFISENHSGSAWFFIGGWAGLETLD